MGFKWSCKFTKKDSRFSLVWRPDWTAFNVCRKTLKVEQAQIEYSRVTGEHYCFISNLCQALEWQRIPITHIENTRRPGKESLNVHEQYAKRLQVFLNASWQQKSVGDACTSRLSSHSGQYHLSIYFIHFTSFIVCLSHGNSRWITTLWKHNKGQRITYNK